MKLQGKVAIITGGTKGIGFGIASEFIREGAKVTICSTTASDGEKAVRELEALGGEALYVCCDVSKLEMVRNLVDGAVERFGRLDIMVASAGINDPKKTHFLEIAPEQFDRIMGVNLRGLFFCGQYAAREMIKEGHGGVIINMSSVNAWLGLDSQVVYTTSKGGIQQLTKVEAIALAPYGIKVNAMAPGPIDTELMHRVGSDRQLMNTIMSRTPQGRLGTPRECGRLAVFLASEDSDFIFGQSIFNDGGRSFQAFPTPGYKTVTNEEYELLQKTLVAMESREGDQP